MVWLVSILALISSFPSHFSRPLGAVPRAPTTVGITVTFMFYRFSVLWKDPSICLPFRFLLFSHYSSLEQQYLLNNKFFSSYNIWFSGQDWLTPLYRKVLENFMGFIFLVKFLFLHDRFVISCTIPNESPFPTSRAHSSISFVTACCIRLLCDSPFHLYLYITYTCYYHN